MVDFICKGYLELPGTRVERELQNEKFLPNVGFEPGIFCLRSESATTELRGLVLDHRRISLRILSMIRYRLNKKNITAVFSSICLFMSALNTFETLSNNIEYYF